MGGGNLPLKNYIMIKIKTKPQNRTTGNYYIVKRISAKLNLRNQISFLTDLILGVFILYGLFITILNFSLWLHGQN